MDESTSFYRGYLFRSDANRTFSDSSSFYKNNLRQDANKANLPCVYPDAVDFRLIVIASNRASALTILLHSLEKLHLDGAVAALDIWIDRSKANLVDNKTMLVAMNFSWSLGVTRVHIWPRHVGIYGQWIDTWCPANDSHEMALILEEDIVISPYAWRWLRAARASVNTSRDIAGYTLQSEGVQTCTAPRKPLKPNSKHIAFAYRLLGTWGFAPHPQRWTEFASWYKKTVNDSASRFNNSTFKPYVNKIVMTDWYKQHERTKRQDSMWSMWFIYFTNMRNLYTIYNNLNNYIHNGTNYLSVHNTAYGGIHFKAQKSVDIKKTEFAINAKLLNRWRDDFVSFPKSIDKFDYNGKGSTLNLS